MTDFLSQVREEAEVLNLKRKNAHFAPHGPPGGIYHQCDTCDREDAYDRALVRATLKLAAERVLANDPKGACSNHQQGVRDAASLVAGLAEQEGK